MSAPLKRDPRGVRFRQCTDDEMREIGKALVLRGKDYLQERFGEEDGSRIGVVVLVVGAEVMYPVALNTDPAALGDMLRYAGSVVDQAVRQGGGRFENLSKPSGN